MPIMYNDAMKIAPRRSLPFYAVPIIIVVSLIVTFVIVWVVIGAERTSAPSPKADRKPVVSRQESHELLLPGAKTPISLPIDKSFLTRPDGQLILVNKSTPIDLNYTPPDLVVPGITYRTDKPPEEILVRAALAKPLEKMFTDAKAAGHDLLLGSAYRSSKMQEMYFNSYAASSGIEEAEKYSAHPGTSEHQLGLAVDISTVDRKCYLETCFEETEAGKWLAANAHTYGFILRYPKDKTDITGYNYEPWHFRYVGTPISLAIFESGLSYEEAFPYINGDKKP